MYNKKTKPQECSISAYSKMEQPSFLHRQLFQNWYPSSHFAKEWFITH